MTVYLKKKENNLLKKYIYIFKKELVCLWIPGSMFETIHKKTVVLRRYVFCRGFIYFALFFIHYDIILPHFVPVLVYLLP